MLNAFCGIHTHHVSSLDKATWLLDQENCHVYIAEGISGNGYLVEDILSDMIHN
jgi:hypothetical protein